jgi:thiamine phosphate phosphatase / amino-HMP aminohydrolase
MDDEGKGTGKMTKEGKMGICTGHDKLREMKTVLEKKPSSESVVTVYVGDSNTDLPCLLHADIGIIIGEGKSVIETCNRVGIKVHRELSSQAIKPKKEKAEPILYHYDDWTAILNSNLLD